MKKIFLLLGLIILVLCSCSKQPAKKTEIGTPVVDVVDTTLVNDTTSVSLSGISYETPNDTVELFHGNKGTTIKCIHSGTKLMWYRDDTLVSVEEGELQIFYNDNGEEEIFPRLNY